MGVCAWNMNNCRRFTKINSFNSFWKVVKQKLSFAENKFETFWNKFTTQCRPETSLQLFVILKQLCVIILIVFSYFQSIYLQLVQESIIINLLHFSITQSTKKIASK